MKWLIILFIMDGEPSFSDGWLPRQFEDCAAAKARMEEYLQDDTVLIECFDHLNRDNVDALAATYGVPA